MKTAALCICLVGVAMAATLSPAANVKKYEECGFAFMVYANTLHTLMMYIGLAKSGSSHANIRIEVTRLNEKKQNLPFFVMRGNAEVCHQKFEKNDPGKFPAIPLEPLAKSLVPGDNKTHEVDLIGVTSLQPYNNTPVTLMLMSNDGTLCPFACGVIMTSENPLGCYL